MNVTVKGTSHYHFLVPVPAKEAMELKIQCTQCRARYAVIGSAYFCPCCGHNSIEETFESSLIKIESKIKNLNRIVKAVAEVSKDDAELTRRSIIESSLSEGSVAFQRLCEMFYKKVSPGTKLKPNAFQNLEIGGEYWNLLFGESYETWLGHAKYSLLNKLLNKRHLLSHTEGIVDHRYINNTGDTSYSLGQRIVVKEKDVATMVTLVRELAAILKSKVEWILGNK